MVRRLAVDSSPRASLLRSSVTLIVAVDLAGTATAAADVVGVTVTTRTPVADGRVFGTRGTYEQLTGRIEFAVDPADPHNRGIVDLECAPRDAQGRVHFTSDLYVVQPTDPAKGNGVMLFEVANRGGKGAFLAMFGRGAENDPTTAAGAGDGFLMTEGYSLVWVGWARCIARGFPAWVEMSRSRSSQVARLTRVARARRSPLPRARATDAQPRAKFTVVVNWQQLLNRAKP